ncbi:hypothetical protein BDW74DRAFT_179246 [Aspergillus multicolor]|uniref:uncharacterized protein n=1 Tax=Aspergillus multicolor TaxID=41759 RepID=UPI003CCE1F3E
MPILISLQLLYDAMVNAVAAAEAQGQYSYETSTDDYGNTYVTTTTFGYSTIYLHHTSTTDSVEPKWSYNFAYDDYFKVNVWSPDEVDTIDEISTTVLAPNSSTTIPASAFASLGLSQTTSVWLNIYMMEDGSMIGTHVTGLVLRVADPTTATFTSRSVGSGSVTTTTTVTATATTTTSDDGSSGLSTGAKAGIGIGIAAGVLLLVAIIGFLIYRRRKRNYAEPPKTIREISGLQPTLPAVFPNGNWSPGLGGEFRPGSLPMGFRTAPLGVWIRIGVPGLSWFLGGVRARMRLREEVRERFEMPGDTGAGLFFSDANSKQPL